MESFKLKSTVTDRSIKMDSTIEQEDKDKNQYLNDRTM